MSDHQRSGDAPVGVLALQGAFALHIEALQRCGVEAQEVRNAEQLAQCRALVLPGGESTTMLKLLDRFELFAPLAERLANGFPVFGTCAGMILLASDVADGRPDQRWFSAIDVSVRRNGYGRQINSFEADLVVSAPGFDPESPILAAFIRAPKVEKVGAEVEVLAAHEGVPVVCRQGNVLVASFHPELTGDDRLHRYFLRHVAA